MRDPENIRAVSELGIDLMGFIFWEKSPRHVENFQFSIVNSQVSSVAVFVNESIEVIAQKVREYQFNYVQLHGNESPEYIDTLRRSLSLEVKIIKALSIREADDVKRWRLYDGYVDLLLFDTKCKCVGGSGEKFDWSVLDNYDGNIQFLLSGGIGPDDVERVKEFHHPSCIGIDLNSKFETAPGLKNSQKLKEFIAPLRH